MYTNILDVRDVCKLVYTIATTSVRGTIVSYRAVN